MRHFWSAALLAAWLSLATAGAVGFESQVAAEKGSGLKITVSSWYASFPTGGFLPLDVTIENASGEPRSWTIKTLSGVRYGRSCQIGGSTEVTVPDGAKRTFHLLAPSSRPENYYSDNTSVQVQGYGLMGPMVYLPASNRGVRSVFHLMSETLATPVWAAVEEEAKKKGVPFDGASVRFADMPADWRALAGVERVAILPEEIAAFSPGQRGALQEWLARGGELTVYGSPGVPPEFQNAGFGVVKPVIARTVDVAAFSARIVSSPSPTLGMWPPSTPITDWRAYQALGGASPHALPLSLCMLLFAVVVGPVNLFVFAGKKRRARLFWTTPALSLAATALLFSLIVLQDGFGGTGLRLTLVQLRPGEKKAVILQEQVVRTGVLTDGRFAVRESAVLTPLQPQALARGRSTSLGINGSDYYGDWFRSRSLQAQWIEAVVPTRAEVTLLNPAEVHAGAAPAVVSSIEATLRVLYYHDGAGGVWLARDLKPGVRATMEKTPNFPNALPDEAGSDLREAFGRLGVPAGSFYALADGSKLVVKTHPAIRWMPRPVVILGTMTVAHP